MVFHWSQKSLTSQWLLRQYAWPNVPLFYIDIPQSLWWWKRLGFWWKQNEIMLPWLSRAARTVFSVQQHQRVLEELRVKAHPIKLAAKTHQSNYHDKCVGARGNRIFTEFRFIFVKCFCSRPRRQIAHPVCFRKERKKYVDIVSPHK